jgi:secondary thiamine-phosphate synthase enzyme
MHSLQIDVDTSRRRIVDLTPELELFCAGLGDGLVNAFVPHATAGLALMETGSGSESDLLSALEQLLPRDDRYGHAHGSTGHGADHLLPALVSPSITLPVFRGRVAFGTWQSLVLVDLNIDNPQRRVRFSFVTSPSD